MYLQLYFDRPLLQLGKEAYVVCTVWKEDILREMNYLHGMDANRIVDTYLDICWNMYFSKEDNRKK